MAEGFDRVDPWAMAEEMGNSLLADWRAFYELKREAELQAQAARRAESSIEKPRRR